MNVSEAQDTLGVVLTVRPGGKISGTVSAQGGGPISGVLVVASDEHGGAFIASSDETGAYQVTGLPTDVYTVRCSHQDYVAAERAGVSVTLGATTSGIDFQLQRGGAIAGTITAVGGGTLADVGVSLEQGESRSGGTATEADGTYQASGIAPGNYDVRFFKEGYWERVQQVSVSAGQTATVDVSLEPAGKISGTVTNSYTGLPLARVNVEAELSDGSLYSDVTDATGGYEIADVEPGDYIVAVGGPGLSRLSAKSVRVDSGSPLPTVDFSLRATGSTAGRVLDSDGATPVPDAIVWLFSDGNGVASTRSGQDGTYAFEVISAGTYEVRAVEQSHGFLPVTNIAVAEGSQLSNVDLLAGTAAINGVVRDGAAQPVASATVSIGLVLPDGKIQTVSASVTDANGVFTCSALHPGSYRMRGRADGLASVETTVDIAVGQTQADAVVELPVGATVSGVLRDSLGNPLPHVTVFVYDQSSGELWGGLASGDDGSYQVEGLVAGTYELRAAHESAGLAISQITLVQGQQVSQDLVFALGSASVSGTVTDDEGKAIPDALVVLADPTGRSCAVASADAQGHYHISNLAPGQYQLSASQPGHTRNGLPLTVGNDDVMENINLILAKVATAQVLEEPVSGTSAGAGDALVAERGGTAAPASGRLSDSGPYCDKCATEIGRVQTWMLAVESAEKWKHAAEWEMANVSDRLVFEISRDTFVAIAALLVADKVVAALALTEYSAYAVMISDIVQGAINGLYGVLTDLRNGRQLEAGAGATSRLIPI